LWAIFYIISFVVAYFGNSGTIGLIIWLPLIDLNLLSICLAFIEWLAWDGFEALASKEFNLSRPIGW